MKTQPHSQPAVPQTHESHRPARKRIGTIDGVEVYQLEESTGCLDCYRRIPCGAIVAMQPGVSGAALPTCLSMTGLDTSKLALNGTTLSACRDVTCPASVRTPLLRRAAAYAAKVRSQEFKDLLPNGVLQPNGENLRTDRRKNPVAAAPVRRTR